MLKAFNLIDSKEILEYILKAIHNVIVILDEDKNVLYANTNLDNVCNIKKADGLKESKDSFCDFINCKDREDLSDFNNIIDAISKNIDNRDVVVEEISFLNTQNEQKYFKASILPIVSKNQKLYCVTLDDITKEKELYQELENADSVVLAIANSVEAKDKLTKGHVHRVAYYAQRIGEELKMSEKELEMLKKGAILHDIGKIGTPDHILNKPGPLTQEEFVIMKDHAEAGGKIIGSLKSFKQIHSMVKHHHEKLDGSGYPDGLKADEIDIYTRIIAIVDIYDAVTSDRPYRPAMTKEKAFEILDKEVGFGKLDGSVVDALKKVVDNIKAPILFDEELTF